MDKVFDKVASSLVDKDPDEINNDLRHIKTELLVLILFLIVIFIPVEFIFNALFRTDFCMLWKVIVFIVLFAIIRRTKWFCDK